MGLTLEVFNSSATDIIVVTRQSDTVTHGDKQQEHCEAYYPQPFADAQIAVADDQVATPGCQPITDHSLISVPEQRCG